VRTLTPVLRQARRTDIPGILRVRYAVSENRLDSRVISETDVAEALERTGRGWVIELGDDIVAFTIGIAQTGNIWALFVAPPHEGLGYGKQLYDTVVKWLRTRTSGPLWLTTQPGTRAERFYARAGWIRCGSAANGNLRLELPASAMGQA
jgi:GNAT superfamily N-acetyltransferase